MEDGAEPPDGALAPPDEGALPEAAEDGGGGEVGWYGSRSGTLPGSDADSRLGLAVVGPPGREKVDELGRNVGG